MARNMSWFQARTLAYGPGKRPIRRESWRRWLVRGVALWKTSFVDEEGVEVLHVSRMGVKGGVASEWSSADAIAHDWTDEVWIVDGMPGSYPPGSGDTPSPEPPEPGGGGGEAPPGSSGGAGNWGGGGPPSPGDGDPTDDEPHSETPPSGAPTIGVKVVPVSLPGVRAEFTPNACYYGGFDTGSPPTSEFTVEVSIAGGPAGVGTMSVTFNGSTQLGTGWRGMNRGHTFAGVAATPGASRTATVSYTIGGDTFSGSGTYTFPPWCSGTCAIAPAVFDLEASGIPYEGTSNPNTHIETDWLGPYWRFSGTIPGVPPEDQDRTYAFYVHCTAGLYQITLTDNATGFDLFNGYAHPGEVAVNTLPGLGGTIGLTMLPDGR